MTTSGSRPTISSTSVSLTFFTLNVIVSPLVTSMLAGVILPAAISTSTVRAPATADSAGPTDSDASTDAATDAAGAVDAALPPHAATKRPTAAMSARVLRMGL